MTTDATGPAGTPEPPATTGTPEPPATTGSPAPPAATGSPAAPARTTDTLADLRTRPAVYRPPLAPQPLAYVPPPVETPEPTRGRPPRLVFFALLAVIALGCSAGGFLIAHARATATQVQPTDVSGTARAAPAPPTPTAAALDGKALLASVVPTPHGAKAVDVGGGVATLGDFADRDFPENPAEKARMRGRNFEWMAERGWQSKGVRYDVQLVEFAPGEGAQSMLRGWESDETEDAMVSSFDIDGAGGAKGYEHTDTGRHTLDLYAVKGTVVVLITEVASAPVDRAAAGSLLRAQLARLPG